MQKGIENTQNDIAVFKDMISTTCENIKKIEEKVNDQQHVISNLEKIIRKKNIVLYSVQRNRKN